MVKKGMFRLTPIKSLSIQSDHKDSSFKLFDTQLINKAIPYASVPLTQVTIQHNNVLLNSRRIPFMIETDI